LFGRMLEAFPTGRKRQGRQLTENIIKFLFILLISSKGPAAHPLITE
jgi:hypothetical protein